MDIETDYLTYNHYHYKNPASIPENFQKHSHNTYEIIFFEKATQLMYSKINGTNLTAEILLLSARSNITTSN